MDESRGGWKRFFRSAGALDRHESTDAAVDLRRALTDLEADLAATEKQLATATADASACEARAIERVRSGDDAGAKQALVDKSEAKGLAERLDAEAAVLKAMIEECRAVLDARPAAGPPGTA
jgi:hypothetical protein